MSTIISHFPFHHFSSGGFRRIYAGLGPAAIGSAPSAALFFCTYETSKQTLVALPAPAAHMAAAALGEVAACLVRVPTEIVKQESYSTLDHTCVRIGKNAF